MGDTETTKVILDINGNNAHKEIERQRQMIQALEEDAVKIAQAFGTQSQQLKDIETKIHRAKKALQSYQATCVELSEIMKKIDISNPRELEKANKALTAKLHDPTIDRNSEKMNDVLKQLGPIRQEINNSNAEINAFMATIKDAGNMSVSELTKADRALKALLATQQQGSEKWKETGLQIQEMTRELDKATAAQKRMIAGANDSPIGKSQQELTRMKTALEESLRVQKQGTSEWIKTNNQLNAVNTELRQAEIYAKQLSSGAWGSVDGKSREELVRMKTALKEVLDSQVQGTAEWKNTQQQIEKVSSAIDKVELETKKASKYAVMDPKKLPLADLKKMESTLNDIIKREQQGTAEWNRANTKLKEVKDQMYQLDIETKRAAIDVEKVLKNMSSANLSELRKTLEVLNKEINSPNIRRGSEEWNRYNAAIKQVTAEIRLLESESKETKSWIDRFNDSMNNWQTTIAATIAAIFALYQQLIEMRNFSFAKEDAKAKLQAITGLDDKSVFWLRDQARKLSTEMEETGMRVRQSSADIMDAFRLTGSNKPELLKNKEGLYETTKEVIRLSQASTMELQPATIALTTALNQFGEGADKARKYVNALAAGSKYGAADVENQTKVIVRSGVAARLAGLSFEDLVAATETLAETGLKGERAGTSMKTVLTRMELGAKECRPSIVGLDQALENMASRANDVEWLKKTFGLWSFSAAKTLIDHRESLKKYRKAVTDTNVAEEQAAIMGKTNVSIHTQLTNKYKELSDDLYEKVGPSILHVTSKMVNWTRTVKEVLNWILENKLVLTELAVTWGLVVAAMKAETIQAAVVEFWNLKLVGSFKKLRAAMLALSTTNIFMLIGAAIASAAFIMANYYDKLQKTREAEKKRWKEVNDAIAEQDHQNGLLLQKYRLMESMLHKENVTMENKKKILAELNKAVPEYKGKIDELTGAVTGNVKAFDNWLKRQKQVALQKAYMDELAKVWQEQAEAQEENNRLVNEQWNAYTKAAGSDPNAPKNKGVTGKAYDDLSFQHQMDEGHLKKVNKELSTSNDRLEKANKAVADWEDKVGKVSQKLEEANNVFSFDPLHDDKSDVPTTDLETKLSEQVNKEKQKAKIIYNDEINELKQRTIKGILDREQLYEEEYKAELKLYEKYIDIMKKYYGEDNSHYLDAVNDKKAFENKYLDEKIKAEDKANKEELREERKEIREKLMLIDAETKAKIANAIKAKNYALSQGKSQEAVELKYNQLEFVIKQKAFDKKMKLYDKDSEEYKRYEAEKNLAAEEYLNKLQEKTVNIQNKLFAKQSSQYRAEIELLDEALKRKLLSQEDYTNAILLLRKKETKAEYDEVRKQGIDLQLKVREKVNNVNRVYQEGLKREKDLLNQGKITQEQYAENIRQLRIQKDRETYNVFQDNLKEWLGKYNVLIQQFQTMLNSYSSMVAASYDGQIQAIENRYDIEIAKAEKAGKDTTKIEKKKAVAVAEMQLEQAEAQHNADVAQALMNTAMAITQAYAQYPYFVALALTPLITAMGAMQVATLNEAYESKKSALQTTKTINAKYYDGGYTHGNKYKREAGIVHEGEFVANHEAVNNPSIRPMLDLIDYAQRNNRVASLTSEDLAMANSYQRHGFASGGYTTPNITVTPPSVNMPSQDILINTMIKLSQQLDEGIHADVSITGPNGLEEKQKRYQRLLANKSR